MCCLIFSGMALLFSLREGLTPLKSGKRSPKQTREHACAVEEMCLLRLLFAHSLQPSAHLHRKWGLVA